MTGIYKITNPNGKIYIGQSIDIERRWYRHKHDYINDNRNTHLYNSFKKYGLDEHTFEVIEECDETQLNKRERYYQEKYNSIEEGLNSIYTKTSHFSGRLSEKSKEKIRKTKRENPYVFTKEDRKKISEGLKGRVKTKEERKKISESKKGIATRGTGWSHSEETKRKISKSNKNKLKGIKQSKEFVRKRAKAISKAFTSERKEQLRLKMLGNQPTNSIKVTIDGVTYNSVRDAVNETGITRYRINKYYIK